MEWVWRWSGLVIYSTPTWWCYSSATVQYMALLVLITGRSWFGGPSRLLQHALMNTSFSPSSQSFQIAMVGLFLPTDTRSARRDPGKYALKWNTFYQRLSFFCTKYVMIWSAKQNHFNIGFADDCFAGGVDASCHEGPGFRSSSTSADGTDAGLWWDTFVWARCCGKPPAWGLASRHCRPWRRIHVSSSRIYKYWTNI